MLRCSRLFSDAAHEAARERQMQLLARRKGVYTRGFVLKFIAASAAAYVAYFPLAMWYSSSVLEENEDGRTLASPTAVHMLEALPLDTISRAMGQLANSEFIPTWVHRRLIDLTCQLYGVDLSDVPEEAVASWRLLQEFFVRRLRDGARPIDEAAFVTSPCDGELIKWGVVSKDSKMVQVKGCTYTIANLFRSSVERPNQTHTATERYYFAFRLGPQDYHRFHAPCAFRPFESVHVPGHLYPVMRAATKWLPMLYVNNERVVLNGAIVGPEKTPEEIKGKKGAGPAAGSPAAALRAVEAAGGKLSMAFVGATCVGGIHLAMDSRIRTNMIDPPTYALHRKYAREVAPLVAKGEEVGHFTIGSAIVMVVDVPKDFPVVVTEGQLVKVGQPLIAHGTMAA